MRALYDSEAHAMYIDVVDPPHDTVVAVLARFGLDAVGILAARDAALRAPDREVTLTVGASLAA